MLYSKHTALGHMEKCDRLKAINDITLSESNKVACNIFVLTVNLPRERHT